MKDSLFIIPQYAVSEKTSVAHNASLQNIVSEISHFEGVEYAETWQYANIVLAL